MSRQLRYIEISRRNRTTRIFVGQGGGCDRMTVCGDVCIDIERAGKKDCNGCCTPSPCYDTSCGCATSKCQCRTCCEKSVAHVCATEIDSEGYAVFHWDSDLLNLKEGWYEGHVKTGCDTCGILPVRIGPRCNVIEVETKVSGPDNLCWADCDDQCDYDVCSTSSKSKTATIYVPEY